ncbi:hypothetical protein P3T36_003189 [Kitasatospora sp. MAP12-15]|uniref:hypothetical protein n=1 Tax=unclassified Kitasatospora TaxID=2633591 RepID=UPI0024759A98|nr:hypothetical protein [Kitasatospora sp. MAP12-44]MDH6111165.1 hypothetical protein [Kitasatospora sp. MAP12-44]
MPHNLWIGRPGSLLEIVQAAKSFDRTADLGVTQFTSLGGRATVVVTPKPVRRTKVAWESLDQATASFLDRLARRVDGPGPIAVIDPVAVNLLEPSQAAGTARPGSLGANQWFINVPSGVNPATAGSIVESTSTPGAFGFTSLTTTTSIGWRHPVWVGIPVMPGMTVSFSPPAGFPASTTQAEVDFKRADGTYITGFTAIGGPVTATVPPNAAFVTPVAQTGQIGTFSLAGACLTINGDVPSPALAGDGCPGVSIVGYTDVLGAHLPYRNVSLELLEVGSAVG